ncbi:ATP-binding protein [Acanthopleuribacter pedis]|uniref:ATP-binding protein n=1 Tax=Acanthopleuribacter pedis TaxID=442870 RepID=A0A8J7U6B2_9BACT|nr:ATP-binding protein [Acanthopleuribacter pedis]MBO1322607.1 ATP-binding protein [Acanthopleuribacter pedis]
MFQRTWPARIDSVRDIMETVEQLMGRYGLAERRVLHMGLVAEELAANIVNHAYGDMKAPPADPLIVLTITLERGVIRMVFQDFGGPFDPNAVPEPDLTASVEDRTVGGLGIYFMRNLVDKVQYLREDNANLWTFEVAAEASPDDPSGPSPAT